MCFTYSFPPNSRRGLGYLIGLPRVRYRHLLSGDLCHEYQAPGFSYDLKDLPGFKGMKVQLKMISDQNAFTRPRRLSPLPDY